MQKNVFELQQFVNYPWRRAYWDFFGNLQKSREIRFGRESSLFNYVRLCFCANYQTACHLLARKTDTERYFPGCRGSLLEIGCSHQKGRPQFDIQWKSEGGVCYV